MQELDFSLATTEEIIKELAQRVKRKRKKHIKLYGDQKKFSEHIGMKYRRYQQFEINGKTTLEKFIDITRGLNAIDEIQDLLVPSDDELFMKTSHKKNTKNNVSKKILNDDVNIGIPDVFN